MIQTLKRSIFSTVSVLAVFLFLASANFAFSQPNINELSLNAHPPKPFLAKKSAKPFLKSVPQNVDYQLQLIDIEILILKAELAQSNAQPDLVNNYLNQLEHYALPKNLDEKVALLRQYVLESSKDLPIDIGFSFNTKNIVVILPLSGPYQKAGYEVLSGLQSVLNAEDIQVVDSSLYHSAFDLWELVKLYQPSFVFGPLRPEIVQQMAELKTGVPMMAFNRFQLNLPYMKRLSPSRLDDVKVLADRLAAQHFQKIIVLSSQDEKSQSLNREFHQLWAKKLPEQSAQLLSETIKTSVDQSLFKVLGGQNSTERKNWLQKTIETPLESDLRPRQDIDAIVSFLPHRLAMQVSPLLDYYHLSRVNHVWLPANLPSMDVFSKTLPFWQNTQAILPFFSLDQANKNNELKSNTNEVGIFYALGQVAVKVANHLAEEKQGRFPSVLGMIEINSRKQPLIQPGVFWLNEGLSKVE